MDSFSDLPNTAKAIGPYSTATATDGLVFISGQLGVDPSTGKLVSNDIEGQTRQVMINIESVLKGLSLKLSNILKTTIFLTDLANFEVVNELYSEALGGHRPARSTIQVSGLPRGGLIEIEVIAER